VGTFRGRRHSRHGGDRGERYALSISAPSLTRGCYGFVYSDANPYADGQELISKDGGNLWTAESARDLKFETSVAANQAE
jgi:hypothetical protein